MKNIIRKQRLHLPCLNLKNSILLVFLSILIMGCTPKENRTPLEIFLSDIDSTKMISDYKAIVYVADANACPSCLEKLAHTTQDYLLNKDSVLIIVNSTGARLDISAFKSDTLHNVVFDYRGKFYQLELFKSKGSGVVLLQNNQVDSIIEINAEDLEEKINFIKGI